ncbi:MAG: hypothetical protein IPK74_03345 [Deltaproteobacteria bacterium]|nr:hypothetical protein [Deltaproteobacteria bacterium]
MRARAELGRLSGIVLAALVAACKVTASSGTSAREPVADDLDAIAQALAANEAELSAAGVVVVARNDAPANVGSPPAAEDAPTEIDDAGGAPVESPPGPDEEPEPDALEAAPTATASQARERVTTVEREARRRRSRRARRAESRADESPAPRCERLCGLAETTCELRDRVCSLADRHPDDIRYDVSCRRADDQCEAASAHCLACEA